MWYVIINEDAVKSESGKFSLVGIARILLYVQVEWSNFNYPSDPSQPSPTEKNLTKKQWYQ